MLKTCITGSVYYLRYRTHLGQSVFASSALCIQMIEAMKFYTYSDSTRFSRNIYVRDAVFQDKRSTLLAFCILPNEYHILLQQNADHGIYQTIKRTHESVSYTHLDVYKRQANELYSRWH